MKREYKINSRNSTVLGYPGRDFDWSEFDWEGKSIHKAIFKGHDDIKAPLPWIDDGLIEPNCQYLHVPYEFREKGTSYRVRPNPSMRAGSTYRGKVVNKQTVIKKEDGWYWVLE